MRQLPWILLPAAWKETEDTIMDRTECSSPSETTTVLSYCPKINKNVLVISINHREASQWEEQMKPIINNSTVEEITAWRDWLQSITWLSVNHWWCSTVLWMCVNSAYIPWPDTNRRLMSGFCGGKWLKSHNACLELYSIQTLDDSNHFRPFIVMHTQSILSLCTGVMHLVMCRGSICLYLSVSLHTNACSPSEHKLELNTLQL